jgi:putative membrane protein
MQWWSNGGSVWDAGTPWFMFLPMLWPILMLGGIIAVVLLILRAGRTEAPKRRHDAARRTPFDILKERFARGEIDRQNMKNAEASCLSLEGCFYPPW